MAQRYRLLKDGAVVNTILASQSEIEKIQSEIDSSSRTDIDTVEAVVVVSIPSEEVSAPRTWTAHDIRTGMTLSERVSWDNDSHNAIVTAKIEMAEPKKLEDTTAVLDLLVDASVISGDTKTAILA
jgi:hypothetical protein